MIGGIAGGLSRRLGIDAAVVRLAIVLATVASGFAFGVALYVAAWLLVPVDGDSPRLATKVLGDWRGIALALSFLPILGLALALGAAVHVEWIGTIATPLCLGAAGLVLVWRNVDDEERAAIERGLRPLARLGLTGTGSWRVLLVRVIVGLLLVAGGGAALVAGHDRAVLRPMAGLLLVLAGVVVIFGPWWLHIGRDLVDERQARALAEERADMAARVHDSVLQTLALIQRRADQPQQVVRLARAQERDLRSWLFEGGTPGSPNADDQTLSAGVRRIQRDVEALHEVPVEAVVVGDCELDEDLRSLLEAGREATVNAAKWSQAPAVSIFAEVEPAQVSMFVRDRGVGFDPSQVGSDRRGLAESVRGRMVRHNGTAQIRSAPGEGTEVILEMPRGAGRPAKGRSR